MPLHDWTKADAGTFHSFHHLWISSLTIALNRGILPKGFYAMAEKFMGDGKPYVLALSRSDASTWNDLEAETGGLALLKAPPKTAFVQEAEEEDIYARDANRVIVRYKRKAIIAAIELVSPGNKHSLDSIEQFVDKSAELIANGVHLLVVDLFPPTRRDPKGIHNLIWDHFADKQLKSRPGKNRTLASYDAGPIKKAYVEPIAVGDRLRDMPLFLMPGRCVQVPLEKTYQTTWDVFPDELREEVE